METAKITLALSPKSAGHARLVHGTGGADSDRSSALFDSEAASVEYLGSNGVLLRIRAIAVEALAKAPTFDAVR